MTFNQLREALEQQRKYERENWPFVGEHNEPTGTGESITYHLAGLYNWSPGYVLTLPPEERDKRLEEIWRSFMIAGDIIKRYEDAVEALLKSEDQEPPDLVVEQMHRIESPGYNELGEDEPLYHSSDEEEEYESEGDGSGLHQCPYCYNLVNSEHEEFCRLNPNRNREIVP